MSKSPRRADIFVSYAREEKDRVSRLVTALEAAGWTVVWDGNFVHGESYRDDIDELISNSHVTLVAWTKLSVSRFWVRSEAERAQDFHSYLPVKLDNVRIPLGLDQKNFADLTEWSRQPQGPLPQDLLNSIGARIRTRKAEAQLAPEQAPLPQALGAKHSASSGGDASGGGGGSINWRPWAASILVTAAVLWLLGTGSDKPTPPSLPLEAQDTQAASWHFKEAAVPVVPCKLRSDVSLSEPANLPAKATVWLPEALIGKVALYVTHSIDSGLLAPLGQYCGGWALGNSTGLVVSPSAEVREDPLAAPKSLVMRVTEDSGSFRNNRLGKLSASLFLGTETEDRGSCAPAVNQMRTFSDGLQAKFYCERLASFEAPAGSQVAGLLGPNEPTALKVYGSASSFSGDHFHFVQAHLVRLDFAEVGTAEALVAYYLSQSVLCEPSTFKPCQGRPTPAAISDCPQCPQMISIPPGRFEMGSSDEEEEQLGVPPDFRGKASPRRTVNVVQPFSLGKYEVTKGQYAAFVIATGRPTGPDCYVGDKEPKSGMSWEWPGFAQTDSDPVVCVSSEDADAYTKWLSTMTGRAYRLPSEAEWEYAARGYNDVSEYWGQDRHRACRYGNVADLTGANVAGWPKSSENVFPCVDGYAFTTDVGTFRANSFGLYDMLGNAAEWVQDCWHDSYEGADSSQIVRPGGDCSRESARGGAWNTMPWGVSSAARHALSSGGRYQNVGFRVARTD